MQGEGARNKFWDGFEKSKQKPGSLKKHVIVLYWSKENDASKKTLDRMRIRHPSVKVKIINGDGDPSKLIAHNIAKLPTMILLRNGREVERITGGETTRESIIGPFFRKAQT